MLVCAFRLLDSILEWYYTTKLHNLDDRYYCENNYNLILVTENEFKKALIDNCSNENCPGHG